MSPAIPPRLWRNSRIAQQLPKHIYPASRHSPCSENTCGLLPRAASAAAMDRKYGWCTQYPSILSLYALNGCGEIWSQTEVVHHAGPQSIQHNPPNCPPTSVLLVLKLKFYTKIFALCSRRSRGTPDSGRPGGRWFESTRPDHLSLWNY